MQIVKVFCNLRCIDNCTDHEFLKLYLRINTSPPRNILSSDMCSQRNRAISGDVGQCRAMSGDVRRHRRDIVDCATRNSFTINVTK